MNKRLLAFLQKRGLATDATEQQAWDAFRALRGLDASIANVLNYSEGDEAARTNCDVMIRALGNNPAEPWNLLAADEAAPQRQAAAPVPPAQPPANPPAARGTDGAALGGDLDLERYRLEGATRESQRVRDINEMAEWAGCPTDFIRQLTTDPRITIDDARARIRENVQTRTRAEELAPDLPGTSTFQAPAQHSRSSQTNFELSALQSALLMRAGFDDPATFEVRMMEQQGDVLVNQRSQPSEAVLRARDRGYEIRGMSLVNMMHRLLAVDGIRCEPTPQGVIHAMQSRGQAMSTSALVYSFSQTFGARMMRGWNEVQDTTEGWVDTEDNPNYLPQEQIDIGMNGEGLAHLPRGATAEDITLSDSHDYTKVVRYARKAVFDEMDVVNDRFDVITGRIPLILGQICRRLRPDLVYAILLANPTMADGVALFHASHGNLLASAGAFAEATLEAAWTAMTSQRVSGVSVNITPTHIIHPQAIAMTVDKTINPVGSTVVLGSTTDVSTISVPVMSRRGLQSRGDARLDNGVIDPKTGTTYAGDLNDWYLAAAGNGVDAPILLSYLAGTRRSPRFRSGTLDRGQFGIWFDVVHNLGAKAVRYQTIRKMVNA